MKLTIFITLVLLCAAAVAVTTCSNGKQPQTAAPVREKLEKANIGVYQATLDSMMLMDGYRVSTLTGYLKPRREYTWDQFFAAVRVPETDFLILKGQIAEPIVNTELIVHKKYGTADELRAAIAKLR